MDRPVSSDPYHLLHEDVVHSKFSKPPTVEESERIEEQGNNARQHEIKRGGFRDTSFDLMLDDPDRASPEDIIVLHEFLESKHPELLDEEGNFDPEAVRDLEVEYRDWGNEPNTEEELEESRKEHEKKAVFNLVLRPAALEKIATDEEQKGVREFMRYWNGHEGPIIWAGFEVGKSKDDLKVRAITGMSVVVEKDGKNERKTIPVHIFRNSFENVMGNKKPHTDITTGLEFINPYSHKKGRVYPGMAPDEIESVMKFVKIGGIGLPKETKYFIGNDFQREKTS